MLMPICLSVSRALPGVFSAPSGVDSLDAHHEIVDIPHCLRSSWALYETMDVCNLKQIARTKHATKRVKVE